MCFGVLLLLFDYHTATQCNTLQYTTTHCNILQHTPTHARATLNTVLLLLFVYMCCSVERACVGVSCSILQYIAVCCSALHCVAVCCSVSHSVCCSVLQCVAVLYVRVYVCVSAAAAVAACIMH